MCTQGISAQLSARVKGRETLYSGTGTVPVALSYIIKYGDREKTANRQTTGIALKWPKYPTKTQIRRYREDKVRHFGWIHVLYFRLLNTIANSQKTLIIFTDRDAQITSLAWGTCEVTFLKWVLRLKYCLPTLLK